jgi:hypothetical protein
MSEGGGRAREGEQAEELGEMGGLTEREVGVREREG